MKIFLDNDIIIKLAALDLLGIFRSLLKGGGSQDIICLPSLIYVLRNKDLLQQQSQERAISFISSCIKLGPTCLADLDIDLGDELVLSACPGIDSGEARLFLATLASPGSVVLTGDKRCLKALCQSGSTIELAARLQGRVLILEQIIIEMIAAHGFDCIKARVLNGVYCDTAIRASFGSGLKAEESSVVLTLQSYVKDVEQCCPAILAPTKVLKGWV